MTTETLMPTAVAIQMPGKDWARLILLPDAASHPALTADEELLLALHTELTAAKAENERLKKDGEQYRKNWLAFQDLTGEQCMEIALPIVEGWKAAESALLIANTHNQEVIEADRAMTRALAIAEEQAAPFMRKALRKKP